MSKARLILAAAALSLGAAFFAAAPASAAPMADRGVTEAIHQDQLKAEQARLVCNAWGRCWRTGPRYYARPMYRRAPRVVCNAWGRCWRRW